MRSPPWTAWIAASSLPSGDQSAEATSSRTSRGVPPATGTRASVPKHGSHRFSQPSAIAISPAEEIARIPAGKMPSGRESELPTRVVKISLGFPSHAAE